ncbi:MAG: NlpC/P60 family protein [Salibacteraceae bacterium]
MKSKTLYVLAVAAICTLTVSCKAGKKATKNNRSQTPKVLEEFAQRMGVSSGQLQNPELYSFIRQWEGTPYKYGGTDRRGTDCSGFIGTLYREVYNLEVPRTTSQLAQFVRPVSIDNLSEGDMVFFDLSGKKHSHVGVYLVNDYFVHASSSRGVIISSLKSPYYRDAITLAGRPPGK